jgi:hypothetical protein
MGCGSFFNATCGDGSIGVLHNFVSAANGCTVRVYRKDVTTCNLAGLTILAQATCLNVP